jgi:hypothetical protein
MNIIIQLISILAFVLQVSLSIINTDRLQYADATTNITLFAQDKSNGIQIAAQSKTTTPAPVKDSVVQVEKNAIKTVWIGGDNYLNVEAELVEKCEVKISIYNMLGKEILKVYQGTPDEKNEKGYYTFKSQQQIALSKNVYVVVMQSNTFRIAEKIIVAQ